MENTIEQVPVPFLKEINMLLGAQLKIFQERVTTECNMSLPTYYRAVHDTRHISRAEYDKIGSILDEMLKELKEKIDQIRLANTKVAPPASAWRAYS